MSEDKEELEEALLEINKIFEDWKKPIFELMRKSNMPPHTKRLILELMSWGGHPMTFGERVRRAMEEEIKKEKDS